MTIKDTLAFFCNKYNQTYVNTNEADILKKVY